MEYNEMIMLAAASLLAADPLSRPALAVLRARDLWLEVLKQEQKPYKES